MCTVQGVSHPVGTMQAEARSRGGEDWGSEDKAKGEHYTILLPHRRLLCSIRFSYNVSW